MGDLLYLAEDHIERGGGGGRRGLETWTWYLVTHMNQPFMKEICETASICWL